MNKALRGYRLVEDVGPWTFPDKVLENVIFTPDNKNR